MQIRPHYSCIDTRSCAHQMVVVVPVNADSLKTPNINKEYRKQGYKRGERSISRHPYTENCDSDNDGHHSLAECFESCRSHSVYSTRQPARLASTQDEIRDSSVQASDNSENGDSPHSCLNTHQPIHQRNTVRSVPKPNVFDTTGG